jgi:hypothetical protein
VRKSRISASKHQQPGKICRKISALVSEARLIRICLVTQPKIFQLNPVSIPRAQVLIYLAGRQIKYHPPPEIKRHFAKYS